jgi:hypothetical protein
MRVITDNPIIEDHSNALGDKWRERRARKGKTSSGIKKSKGDRMFSKEKRSERKTERQAKREARDGYFSKSNIEARRTKRKNRRLARKGATPLQEYAGPGGTKVYKEPMPVVTENSDGSFTKVIPANMDNPVEVVNLPETRVEKIETPGPAPDILVDTEDVKEDPTKPLETQTNPTTGTPEAVKTYTEEEIEIVEDEDTGQKEIHKKTNLTGKKPMSKNLKIGLIVGGVVVVGVISYLVYRNMTKNKPA